MYTDDRKERVPLKNEERRKREENKVSSLASHFIAALQKSVTDIV